MQQHRNALWARRSVAEYLAEETRHGGLGERVGAARLKDLDKRRLSLYIVDMIRSFRHAGLKRFYERGDRRRLLAEHVPKIARVLAQLDIATDPVDMDLPGFHLHPLTGNLAEFWSVTVRANWRIIFRFDDHGDATDVDYVDYH